MPWNSPTLNSPSPTGTSRKLIQNRNGMLETQVTNIQEYSHSQSQNLTVQNNPKFTQPSQQDDKSTQYNTHYVKTCEGWRVFLYGRTFTLNLQVSTLAGNSYKRITNKTSFTVLLLLMKLQYLHKMRRTWCVRCKTLTLSSPAPAPIANINKTHAKTEMARLCHRCPTFRRGEVVEAGAATWRIAMSLMTWQAAPPPHQVLGLHR